MLQRAWVHALREREQHMNVKSSVRRAARAVSDTLAASWSDLRADSATDILDTLKKEHTEVKKLLVQLSEAETSAQRRALVVKIKAALVPHTTAEEKVVYDSVIALRDKEAQMDGHEGYLEHEWAAKTLQRLESMANAASPEHKAAGKVLRELVEHHIREEESNVWRDVKNNFSDDERKQMNVRFAVAKRRVKA
jgi:hemerythrin superfamily protein